MNLILEYNPYELRLLRDNIQLISGVRKRIKFFHTWQVFNSQKILISEIRIKVKFSFDQEFQISYFAEPALHNLNLYCKVGKNANLAITFKNDFYQIIVHKGNKFSFFKNDRQFAYLFGSTISVGVTKRYQIVADDDIDLNFLCTIAYCIFCTKDTDDGITIEITTVFPELKKFDDQWRPRLKFGNQ